MIVHLVLFTPREELSESARRDVAAIFEGAVRAIPSVRGVHVGRRVRVGAAYEGATNQPTHVAILTFENVEGLQTYLDHPAHEGLGPRLRESAVVAGVYDFDVGSLDFLQQLV